MSQSAVSDRAVTAFARNFLGQASEWYKVVIGGFLAINTGTNIPSVATPNGQPALHYRVMVYVLLEPATAYMYDAVFIRNHSTGGGYSGGQGGSGHGNH